MALWFHTVFEGQECGSHCAGASGSRTRSTKLQWSCHLMPAWLGCCSSSLLVALLYGGCSQHGFPRKTKDRWKPTGFYNLIPEETGHRLLCTSGCTDLCWYTEQVEHGVCTPGVGGRLAILEAPYLAGLSCKTVHRLIWLSVVEPDNTVTKPAPLGTCN